MFFSGIQKSSLIDYPGKVSCILFVSGCNFTCPYCHNPELALGRKTNLPSISEDDALKFLSQRKGLLDGVVITGGEPTLQADLTNFCRKVKALAFPIKLDTNGSRPETLRQLLHDQLIDYIAMDIKTDPNRYAPHLSANRIGPRLMESIQVILETTAYHEFRTTCLSPFVDADTIGRIARLIQGAHLYVLQNFQEKRVLDPEFIQNNAHRYSAETMAEFQSLAKHHVKRCIIR
ncbi:MAG: anaerobic ribonucleoside-triphosphate reductase activating protein [Deltaproteobacteria bacterium]|nr:anaerobic ribonucleoside-triphosphate reductase activating protein [Deltaproteobacteria bacterium]